MPGRPRDLTLGRNLADDDGFNAAQATITHNISPDEDVIVTVLSNDASELLIGDAPGSGAVTEIEPSIGERVLVVPGAHFGVERHLRISYGLPEPYLTDGLARVGRVIEALEG